MTPTDPNVLADVEQRVVDLEALVPGLRQRLASLPDPDDSVLSPRATRALEELRRMVRYAVNCHFEKENKPRLIRLHMVKDEVIVA